MKKNEMIKCYELNDEELEMVWGGSDVQYMRIACPHCGNINNVNVRFGSYKCEYCNMSNMISG